MPKDNTISKKQVVVPAIIATLIVMTSTTLMSGVAYAQSGLHLVGDVAIDVDEVAGTITVSGEVAGAGRTAPRKAVSHLQVLTSLEVWWKQPNPSMSQTNSIQDKAEEHLS
jgi:hypothetical protein